MTTAPAATAIHPLYEKHKGLIEQALAAFHSRAFWAGWPEMPSPKTYGETADAEGRARFEAQLGKPFDRLQQEGASQSSDEVSAFTRKPLGITYPAKANAEAYVTAAQAAGQAWKKADVHTRAGVLVEGLDRIKDNFFEIAYATMHGTGQGYMMAFQASGPHGNDRCLEAVALGLQEQTRYPADVTWDKPAGKSNLVLRKHFRAVPKGIAVAIACSTFPIWNTLPGVYASLITGNPVIVKPHPLGIYSLAIAVAAIQQVLVENGFSAELIQLAPDRLAAPITKDLVQHPDVKIIDYTGSTAFGDWLEALPGKTAFTEKSGINSVIIESTTDLNAMAQNLAMSMALYSGQMCTKPQNFYIPQTGVKVAGELLPYDTVVAAIVDAARGLAENPKMGPAVLGAIQSDATYNRVQQAASSGAKVLLAANPVQNPDFPEARIFTPLILEAPADRTDLYQQEMFGGIFYIIPTDSAQHSLALAQASARKHGAISCACYTTDEAFLEQVADAMAEVGTPVGFNLTGGVFINQNASFSDFHVTGGNPAGNATLTNPQYVLGRFVTVGIKVNTN